jgi:hypothetical protein
LQRLISRLPRHSHFYASLLDNEEDAAELLKRGEVTTFGMRDWTYDRELLSLLIEEIRSFHSTMVAVNTKNRKGFTVSPMPRPVTALDRLKRRERWTRHDELVRKVRPQQTHT